MPNIVGDSSKDDVPAVFGTHSARGAGVLGAGARWTGVVGTSVDQTGVTGISEKFIGVWGESKAPGFAGLYGLSQQGDGIVGESKSPTHSGVAGKGTRWTGVHGSSVDQTGVTGISEKFVGIWAETKRADHPALLAKSAGGRAGRFEGNVEVTGDLLLTGADVAEQFDVAEHFDIAGPDDSGRIAPGTVVVLDDTGALAPCTRSYDTRVAGVVSGAGDRVPALILDRTDAGARANQRRPVAVVGKVWCQAHASAQPIRVGDLLTTSGTCGHAMRAVDRDSAFGAVLGKALTPLASGAGLVLVLVGLC